MQTYQHTDTVGSIVAQRPALSRVFEQAGIDYCCGGGKSLAEASRKNGIDVQTLIALLDNATASDNDEHSVNVTAMTLTELADHIEQTHHAYLKSEFPRLDVLTAKVSSVHGEKDARLARVRNTFVGLQGEMLSHMMKEERILFPMIRQIEAGDGAASHCGPIAYPIRQMEAEHEEAGTALALLRELTDGYTAPEWGCNTYRAMLDALANFERDLHQHIHKENNVLFPKAIALTEETVHQ